MIVRRPAICVITRGRGGADSPERTMLLGRLEAAASAGATMIQIRERQFGDRDLLELARQVVEVVARHGAIVTLNERTDVALASGAGGVHLKSNSPSVADVRRIVPAGFVVGRSVHSVDDAVAAEAAGGCDYLLFGTVFPSASKPPDHPIAGIDALDRVCRSVALPVMAIGGISVERARMVASTSAAGIAAISLFSESSDIARTVCEVRDTLTPSRGTV
jgi:thiamine-phosphate pyrophosphorylase